ncbi:hypothetical protein DICSQDRAFT_136296 [Dichomitus squalens LYAD-421 SS1]|uniref:Uncharacterized protein n=2 Tax=Dichomitus squalens TaxID=114155 RepID=A0A4Q9Q7H2_9APHY|nr:uncharacterized protein DICSQDRAFT_136296 [Dichomitus squalens LYAD-421 SS1]EJF61780.1 hypothetical protein DICSQDRAFT_136296 [Dichomitus squalens LYAD-421 SS1]TBU63452.1 hypothetical protein BD310DRAFT_1021590 [Dichomitus squalens]
MKSIKFKRTTPGSITYVVTSNRPPYPKRVLDPTHPALHLKPSQYANAFPWRAYPGFGLRALPKSLLDKPSVPFPDPPFSVQPPRSVTLDSGQAWDDDGGSDATSENRWVAKGTVKWAEEERWRISMSLVDVVAKGVGGRVVRVKVLNKLKNAIALVVTRGADVEEGADGAKRIVFREREAGSGWVLRDWTYLCRPEPQLNLMPYTELIPSIRRALKDVFIPGQKLEDEWSTPAALQVAQLLASLGALGGSPGPATGRSANLVAKSAELKRIMDELAKHGVTAPGEWEVQPGDTFLSAMLKRYRELIAETRAEASASLSAGSSASPSTFPIVPHRAPPLGNADAMRAIPGRDAANTLSAGYASKQSTLGDETRRPRFRGDESSPSTYHPTHRAHRSIPPQGQAYPKRPDPR